MKKTVIAGIIIICSLILISCKTYARKLYVVATYPFLKQIAQEIGGKFVRVYSISTGKFDPHFIEPRPSMVSRLRRADALIKVGMDLDIWVQSLSEAARNSKIVYGASGYIDVSKNIEKLEVPRGKIDASMGHLHIFGNPHYFTDPENAIIIARNIEEGFSRLMPSRMNYFLKNYKKFSNKIKNKIKVWQEIMAPFKNYKIVTYHNSWPYFAKRFSLKIIGCIEPKPGIPPSPSHVNYMINKMKTEKVALIIAESYFEKKTPKFLKKKTGCELCFLPVDLGVVKHIKTYIALWDYNIKKISTALAKYKAKHNI